MHTACRAQAALDFLMTYGWALLLIAIATAAVFSLGIVDAGSFVGTRAIGFSQVEPSGWALYSNGTLAMKLRNHAGSDINITGIAATTNGAGANYTGNAPLTNGALETGVISVGALLPSRAGSSYSIRITIDYLDSDSGFAYRDSGTISGRVV